MPSASTTDDVEQELQLLRAEIGRERAARQVLEDRLVSAAHQAGMAEVATNVLHAVGNVLTTVTVSATTMAERLKASEVEHFADLARLLETHQDRWSEFVTQDERGRHLPVYLVQAVESLLYERGVLLDELATLSRGIDHIRAVISDQQRHARMDPSDEWLQVDDLIATVVALHRSLFDRHRIQVVAPTTGAHLVRAGRHAVIRILINLVSNAVAALRDQPGDRRLQFMVIAEHEVIAIQIDDSGVGFAPSQRATLFQRGFTTRHDGHGFGLQDAAVQAADLGGSLEAASPGPGAGATFTLRLPRSGRASHESV